jgi:hypothetical protein
MAVQAELAYAQTFLAGLFELHAQADSVFQGAAARVCWPVRAALGTPATRSRFMARSALHWECDVHWLLKRAHCSDSSAGRPAAFAGRCAITARHWPHEGAARMTTESNLIGASRPSGL